MANYYREKGKDKVYTKENNKWRHVKYAEAKEKNIWKDVKEVKAGTLSFVTNKDMSVVRKLAAEKLLGRSKTSSVVSSKQSEKKTPKTKAQTVAEEDWKTKSSVKKKKVSAVRKLAAEKLSYKESTNDPNKAGFVKVETLKDGNVVGYKADGNWTLIKSKYVRRVTLKNGTVVGYKPNGQWEVIVHGKKANEPIDKGDKELS